MDKAKIQENTQKLIEFVGRKFEAGELDNDSLVELFKHCGMYLNLRTIPEYAKQMGMSYEGVKKFRKIEEIYGVKFVIDNE
jgi:hypothetical protein